MATDIESLAQRLKQLEELITAVAQSTQLQHASLSQGAESIDLADAVDNANETPDALAALQDALDANEDALAAAAEQVAIAIEAAQEASDAGIAAGELANAAADQAIANAQTANDAAADAKTRADNAKTAADAAGATAGSASAAASAAQSAADSASTAASAAQATANGKNAVTYSTAVPSDTSNPGTRAGDIWFVRNANGWLSAQYEWSGSTWQVRSLDSAILAYIDAGKITAGTISADRIGANSITASKLAADSVTSNAILAGTIQAVDIASGTITGDRIAAATLTASLLMADTITSREIAADAILARNIKAAEITGDKIAARTIAAGNIQAGTITGNEIAANTITAAKIQAGTITATEINLDTLNGKTITGATVQTAATGKRVVLANNVLTFWGLSGSTAVPAGVIEGVPNGSDRGMIQVRSSTDGTVSALLGNVALPVSGSVNLYADTAWVSDLWVTRQWDAATGQLIGGSSVGPTTIPVASAYTGTGATALKSGNQVYLQGQIATSSGAALASSASNIGTLAAAFRPAQPQIFLVAGGGGFVARVQIGTDGVISYAVVTGSSSYLRIDAVSYRLS